MRTIIVIAAFLIAGQLAAQKIMTYNVAEGFGKKTEELQTWMQEQKVDIAAFQEANVSEDEAKKIAKKWKHKHTALVNVGGKNLLVTSRYPIQLGNANGYLTATINKLKIYVAQVNKDSLHIQQALVDKITESMQKQANVGVKVVFLGHVEGYAKSDSSAYTQRFRMIPIRDRANREIIKQISSYSKRKNYQLLKAFTEKEFYDPIAAVRTQGKVEYTFPSKKMGDIPEYRSYRVDYILLSPNLRNLAKDAQVVRDRFTHKFSTHYPVVVSLGESK
ncbi:MAG: hypothetical protein AAGG68_26710 [Bacteroidota bacterium]